MNIRKAKQEDYNEIMLLFNGFVEEDRYSNHDFDSFKKVLASEDGFVFVAQEGEKLIGFSTMSIRNVVRYPRPIAELDELYVVPDYRRKGIGKALLDICIDTAKSRSCYRIYLESHKDREHAHAFYEKHNFIKYGHSFSKDL